MDIIQVNQQTCTQCGICAAECPGKIIDFQAGDYPLPGAQAESRCLRCGHCVVVCPSGSLTHREMAVEQCPPIIPDLQVTAAQCEQLIRSRRSIRVYQDRPVPRELITRLIEIARYAPTGHNNQNVAWLVIDDRDELRRLEAIGVDWIRWVLRNQPKMAAGLDMKGMLERAEKGNNTFLRGAPVLVVAHGVKNNPIAVVDCTIALSYLDLAADSLGLGGCWAGFVYRMANSFPPMIAALSLPEGHTAYGCMMLGYPKFGYHRLPLRRPPKITWH